MTDKDLKLTTMIEKLDRGRVVKTWIGSGIQDFLIAFQIDEEFPFFVAFLYHQGLEKISKGYLLGHRSVEYESLPFQQAKEKINQIVIDKKKIDLPPLLRTHCRL